MGTRLAPILLSTLALLSGRGAAAAPAAPAAPAVQEAVPRIAFDKTTLPNGLEVILVEDHRLPIVAVNLWYHAGPANEAPGLTGFAHLFEHMMFAGSRHLPRGLADRLLESAGATDSNGSTDYDRTNYYDTVPSNQLALALWVHADRMGYLLDVLNQAALSNQQDVVRNERRDSVENRPYGIAEEALNHALFPKGHPYYASVIGSHADIQGAKLADVRDFFRRYYGPNNASLVIAGDIDKARALALVTKYFGSLKAGPAVARAQASTPAIARERRIKVSDRVELPRVYMGWLTPPAYQPGDAALAVTAQILAGGRSSRLYKSLVYERQVAQEASAVQNGYALSSTFVLDATARPGGDPAEIERGIDAELQQLRDAGPTDAELERARNTLETRMLAAIERLGGDGLANQLNAYNQYTGDPGYLPKDIARLRAVTAADVRHAVQTWLRPEARVVVEVQPGTPDLGPDAVIPSTPPPVKAAASTAAGGINAEQAWRAQPPKAGPAPRLALPEGESFRLPNGLTVIHHHNPALPLVAAELVVRSGSDANPADLPGLAGYTARMLQEGTATRSAPQIADEMAHLGAFLHSASDTDASTVSLLALRSTFARALDVLADVVLHPAFPNAEVERQRASRLGALTQQRDDPALVAQAAAAGALYGPRHAYGHGQLGTEQSIRAATRDKLVQFWRRHYLPSNAALVVSGDITLDELRSLAAARFGAWASADPAVAVPGDPAPTSARLVIVDKPGAAQTALQVAAVGAARKAPDYAATQLLNTALGGQFSSRVNMNLREDKGYSYGMFSSFRYDRAPGPFAVEGSVRGDATGASVREIFKEVQALRDAPLPARELAAVRDARIHSLPAGFETNGAVNASLADLFVFDLPADTWRTLPDQYRRVTAAQVQEAARTYLQLDRMKVIAVGDRKAILPQLQALGLGRPELRDADGQVR